MPLRGETLRRLSELVGPENITGEHTVSAGTPQEVASVLRLANAERLQVTPAGNFCEQDPRQTPAGIDLVLSLRRLNKLKQYEPADLTASMEAGITVAEVSDALALHRQWLPLGCPERATMGGVLATNASGPFRLFYGAARDMVIGMRFATAEGKLVNSGGMVVKNVAGYDMAKLLIGSWGTLAVITDVNVKVFPRPATETTALAFHSLADALQARGALLNSVLSPLALDLFDAAGAALAAPQEFPRGEFVLAVAYGGVEKVIERSRREVAALGQASRAHSSVTLAGEEEQRVWKAICDLPATVSVTDPGGLRLKLSSTLQDMQPLLEAALDRSGKWGTAMALVARAGSGVSYIYARGGDLGALYRDLQKEALSLGAHVVVEAAPPVLQQELRVWRPDRDDYPVMLKLKQAFDPNGILNSGRLVC